MVVLGRTGCNDRSDRLDAAKAAGFRRFSAFCGRGKIDLKYRAALLDIAGSLC
jgi:hypothetical protein